MRYIKGVRLVNWQRFRGTHELDLEPGVYSITAQDETDPLRSNWLGKSGFVAALRFGVTGEYPSEDADGWITNGELEGGVDLEFDDGVFVSRTRKRGQATQVAVEVPAMPEPVLLKQEEAETELRRRLGMSKADFAATSFFEQGTMAAVITETPANRTARVNGWLKMDQVEEAHADVMSQLVAEMSAVDKLGAEIKAVLSRPQEEGYGCELSDWRGVVTDELERERKKALRLEEEQRSHDEAVRKWNEAERKWNQRQRYEGLLAVVAELKELLVPELGDVREEEVRLRGVFEKAQQALVDAKKLARGEFDGNCPVAKIRCPIAGEINEPCAARSKEVKNAEEAADAARTQLAAQRARVKEIEGGREEALLHNERLRLKKRSLEELKEHAEAVDPGGCPVREKQDTAQVALYEQRLNRAQQLLIKYVEKTGEQAAKQRRIKALRRAALILGKEGVQRQLTEMATLEIEEGANGRISNAGIPLVVEVVWGKEIGRPADDCSHCGVAFPRSAAVKVCPGCGHLRGKQRDGKLYIRLSNVSGAARDIAGVAFSLAASSWLRAERGIDWGVVVLDEPMGQLDGANKKALAASLPGMLGEGFSQVFVIAHDRDTLDALPKRILITGHGKDSKVQVWGSTGN